MHQSKMGLRDHPAGERGPERETLTRASRGARTRASVLDSQISHLRREPGCFWRGDTCLGGDLTTGPLSLEMWEQFHRWLSMAQTSQWAAPRWAHHQGLVAAVCPSGARGAGPGAGAACIKRCGCLGGPAASQWAGGREAPRGGNSLAGRAGPGAWPRVAARISRPVFLFKYRPRQPPQNITSLCFALSGDSESLPADVLLRLVRPSENSLKPASPPGKGHPGRGRLLFWALCFFPRV